MDVQFIGYESENLYLDFDFLIMFTKIQSLH